MYHHVKKLMYTVVSDSQILALAICCLSNLAELTASWLQQCSTPIQGLNCEDPDRKDLLMDIGTEELSHLEIIRHTCPLASETNEKGSRCGRS